MRPNKALLEKLNECYNWPVYYRELGYYVKRREEYERSLKYFDKALQEHPDDIRILHGRALSRAKAVKFHGAIKDIQKILSLDPNNISLLAEKALITYLGCEFEEALVQNVKCVPKRKKPDNFVMGVMHCEDAILNCISERAGKPLRDHYLLIREIAWTKTLESQRPYTPVPLHKKVKRTSNVDPLPSTKIKNKDKTDKEKLDESSSISNKDKPRRASNQKNFSFASRQWSLVSTNENSSIAESLHSHQSSLEKVKIPPPPPFPYKPIQNRTSNIENYLAERYLDKLYQDKLFLKNLKTTPGTVTANEKGSGKITRLAEIGFKNVYRAQEILRARRPFYFIKYQEAAKTCGNLEQRKQETLQMLQTMATNKANRIIENLENALKDKSIRNMFENTEKLMMFLDKTPKRVFPQRQEFLTKMMNISCEIFFQTKKFTPEMNKKQKDQRIRILLSLKMDKVPSSDSLLDDVKNWYVDWKKMYNIYLKRLYQATSPEELAWLYHELARFSAEMKKYELASMYARKCVAEGNVCKKLEWIFNALILNARIDVCQRNKYDAMNQVKRAKKIANIMKDEGLIEMCDMSIGIIQTSSVDEPLGVKVLEEREKQIIHLLPTDKQKSEAAYLFRRMATLPVSKRMSPFPGFNFDELIKDEDAKKARAKKRASRCSHLLAEEEQRGRTFLRYMP